MNGFSWRTETMVLHDHKVTITEQSKACLANSEVLPRFTKGEATRSSPKDTLSLEKQLGVKKKRKKIASSFIDVASV